MPLLANAKKALRASKKKTVINRRVKSLVKTFTDAVKKSPSKDTLAKAFSKVDKAVKKNVLHKNKAARLKSQVARLVK